MHFANGRWIVPLATWLAPVFILRFVRTQNRALGDIISLVVSIMAYSIAWHGLIPLSGVSFYLVAGSLGMVFWLPYLADRLLTPRMDGFTGTLVFPLTWTTLEYVYTETNPYASWASLAYTQYGDLPLMQIVSVFGIWAITFLITWFASVLNWMWASDFCLTKIRWGTILFASVLSFVLLFGGLRLTFSASQEGVVRIESVVSSPQSRGSSDSQVLDSYLERTRRQARAGAQIVTWDEGGICVNQSAESLFVGRGRELARQERIYLLMGLAYLLSGASVYVMKPNKQVSWALLMAFGDLLLLFKTIPWSFRIVLWLPWAGAVQRILPSLPL
jgi:apolipoprotein N-acyltransferase